jgi:hypothetical protein
MATINPNIALSVKPLQLENPMNAMAMYSQIEGARQANQLNQMKMAEYERARGEEEGVRNALARGDLKLDTPEGRAGLLQYGKTGLEYGKALTEQQKAVTDRQTAEAKLVADRTKQYRAALDFVNTPEQYLAWHEANHADPIVGPALAAAGVTAESSRGNIMKQLSTPGGFEKLINQSKLGAEKFIERNTLTEADRQRIGLERQRVGLEQNPNVVSKQVVGEDGTVTNFNKFGQVISTVKGAGKQSATYAKTQAQQKTLAADQKLVISELKDAIKEGGLIEQSTGSGAGRLYDAGMGFFGKATEGDVAIGRLQPIADIVLKTVPRFEGPQSDKDTASYKEAAGNLANPNLPRAKRKAAAEEIIRLMEKRQGQFITSDMASGNTATPAGVAPPEGFVPD